MKLRATGLRSPIQKFKSGLCLLWVYKSLKSSEYSIAGICYPPPADDLSEEGSGAEFVFLRGGIGGGVEHPLVETLEDAETLGRPGATSAMDLSRTRNIIQNLPKENFFSILTLNNQ